MNLVIDIGNTRVKAAFFEGREMRDHIVQPFGDFDARKLIEGKKAERAIVASVINNYKKLVNYLTEKINVLEFTSETPVPVKNLYKSMHTLGSDRLAAAVGASEKYPGQNCLVVDAGTCIKYDLINSDSEYLGGGISPGIDMRFKALNNFTDRLPLVPRNDDFTELVGTNSHESILSGVQQASVQEVNGMIGQYNERFPNLNVILTGGDAPFFEKRLKKPIFADPFLVLKGLNAILEFNFR